jgi:hypothetical protein
VAVENNREERRKQSARMQEKKTKEPAGQRNQNFATTSSHHSHCALNRTYISKKSLYGTNRSRRSICLKANPLIASISI